MAKGVLASHSPTLISLQMSCLSHVAIWSSQSRLQQFFMPDALLQTAPADEEYGGETPFSEPESRIVKLVAEGIRPRSFVNLHAGEWALYVPWDSQHSAAPGLPV